MNFWRYNVKIQSKKKELRTAAMEWSKFFSGGTDIKDESAFEVEESICQQDEEEGEEDGEAEDGLNL